MKYDACEMKGGLRAAFTFFESLHFLNVKTLTVTETVTGECYTKLGFGLKIHNGPKQEETVTEKIKQPCTYILEHHLVFLLALALFSLSFIGVGTLRYVGITGFILCLGGLTQGSDRVRLDVWGFGLLILYNLASMTASMVTFRTIAIGYAPAQMLFPVIFLLMACLNEEEKHMLHRLCAIWAGTVAAIGLFQFTSQALQYEAARLGGLVGNPNALGIFLVIGWFAALNAVEEENEHGGHTVWREILLRTEPLILVALSLTLSLGSFCAMAAGIFFLVLSKIRTVGFRSGLWFACCLLSKAAFGFALGILMYVTATRTVVSWVCVGLLLYLGVVVWKWDRIELFLQTVKKAAAALTAMGCAVAAAAVVIRPSAAATFLERLEMMRNGLGYIAKNPLLGVGPYQWRVLNLNDADKYFNTWHIHNALIHVGTELGLIAMAMLILLVIRFYMEKERPSQRAGFTAFVLHNMMDTSFFFPGIVSLTMMTTVEPGNRGKEIRGTMVRVIFGILLLMYGYFLYYSLTGGASK